MQIIEHPTMLLRVRSDRHQQPRTRAGSSETPIRPVVTSAGGRQRRAQRRTGRDRHVSTAR